MLHESGSYTTGSGHMTWKKVLHKLGQVMDLKVGPTQTGPGHEPESRSYTNWVRSWTCDVTTACSNHSCFTPLWNLCIHPNWTLHKTLSIRQFVSKEITWSLYLSARMIIAYYSAWLQSQNSGTLLLATKLWHVAIGNETLARCFWQQ